VNNAGNQALNMGFSKDFGGMAVPQSGSVDIGAFERAP
jgi:hypothetical protein